MARNRDPSLSFLPQNAYTQSGFYNAASGGLARLANGGGVAEAQAEQMLKTQYQKYRNQGGTMSYQQFKMTVLKQAQGQGPMAQEHLQTAANGGRIGLQRGGPPGGGMGNVGRTEAQGGQFGSSYGPGRTRGGGGQDVMPATTITSTPKRTRKDNKINTMINTADNLNRYKNFAGSGNIKDLFKVNPLMLGLSYGWNKFQNRNKDDDQAQLTLPGMSNMNSGYPWSVQGTGASPNSWITKAAQGGRVGAQGGGLIGSHVPGYTTPPGYNRFDYPSGGVRVRRAEGGIMDLGGMEKDYRAEGGFVPIGGKEKADDVPARLSKNEFVFTADAVRNAGGGDIDAGAEVMQNMMDNLEQGGQISEESQGAQGMYNNMKQLETRVA